MNDLEGIWHWAQDIVLTLNQRHWRWFDVKPTPRQRCFDAESTSQTLIERQITSCMCQVSVVSYFWIRVYMSWKPPISQKKHCPHTLAVTWLPGQLVFVHGSVFVQHNYYWWISLASHADLNVASILIYYATTPWPDLISSVGTVFSKRETLSRCWTNAGPPSTTSSQH